ncbi:hypothetical protein Nwat_2648 [Nitrosococcus watsonii C-113]|uniref:Uncharacterized protein n=1 Tax=Nitrosococcus watsoni (strain C-113) TaxID=105559 RepID=D8KAJ8_NITWC|nr:hypothetical protein Nwat_2648 [Nitrosococcus watsonii C-113]
MHTPIPHSSGEAFIIALILFLKANEMLIVNSEWLFLH